MDITTEKIRELSPTISRTITLTILICFISFLPLTSAIAEMRHHDSHVHGEGNLNIAIADKEIHLELESPAANIVGFEHSPENHDQEQAIKLAEKQLRDGTALFSFSKEAQCQLIDAKVGQNISEGHEPDGHHEEHGHDDAHNHDEHHDANKEEHHEEATHSEFHALYHFECNKPAELKAINVMLFDTFNFEKIDVQLLAPKGQTAVTLTHQQHNINL